VASQKSVRRLSCGRLMFGLPLFSRGVCEVTKIALAVLAITVLAVGCGGPKPQPAPVLNAGPGVERVPYRIGIDDKLEIRFLFYPAYNVELAVRPDGAVTIPLVGEVMVEGITPLELEGIVRTRYAEILSEPEVSVIVSNSASQMVFIFGEVRSPGSYPFKGAMTILDAIAGAGGPNFAAKRDNIILIRRSADGSFAGRKVDFDRIIEGKEENAALIARDVLYVPMSRIAKVDLFVSQFFQQLNPVLYFYLSGGEIFSPEGKFYIGD